jgi:hypothetical protein
VFDPDSFTVGAFSKKAWVLPPDLSRYQRAYRPAVVEATYVKSAAQTAVASSEFQSIVATSAENTLFIQHKPKRAALEQPSGGS